MLKQPVLLMEEDWDTLIVLDACRYDSFEKVYSEYFIGELHKRISLGSCTPEWARKSFPRTYNDTVYISSNPHIRNTGIKYDRKRIGEFNAKNNFISEKHFYKIIDVWFDQWNDLLGTVHPASVNKTALIALNKYHKKRIIIHYMQPHYPFISIIDVLKDAKEKYNPNIIQKINKFIKWKLYNLIGEDRLDSIGMNLKFHPMLFTYSFIVSVVGINGLKEAYENNLKLVIEHVAKLLDYLEGTIVITSDHGELLGEGGYYGHPKNTRIPQLIEVPWLEITREKKLKNFITTLSDDPYSRSLSEEDEKIIKERLRKLGYIT